VHRIVASVLVAAVVAGLIAGLDSSQPTRAATLEHRAPDSLDSPSKVVALPNDNRTPAGTRAGDTLLLRLTVSPVAWHILGDSNPPIEVAAFAEEGRAPTIPAPLIRVRAGTPIHAIIRNPLDDTLMVRGLSERGGIQDSLIIAPGGTGEAAFVAHRVGTYQYWGALSSWQRAVPLPPAVRSGGRFRPRFDSQLVGALIIDPPGAVADDRIFVITETVDQVPPIRTEAHGIPGREFTALNGRSWPYTERLHYAVGDSIRWRIINATFQTHPMHLHGFYFRVDSRGDVLKDVDESYAPAQRRMTVTEAIKPGENVSITWSPDRPGGWIFHCHLISHMTKVPPIDKPDSLELPVAYNHDDPDHHFENGMNGLILGIVVSGRAPPSRPWHAAKRLRLFVQSDSAPGDSVRRFGYVLERGAEPRRDSVESPGPTLLLTRGEPTNIDVTNRLTEPTAVHWHGIEIESYYDGVVGWSRAGDRAEHAILPDSTFRVHITPRRAGTFMYHTHFNEVRQQFGGLVGALIVLEPGEHWNSSRELLFVVSDAQHGRVVINGSATPVPRQLHVGTTYRVRIANIAGYRMNFAGRIMRDSSMVVWRAVAKDGFTLPSSQAIVGPSIAQIASGETADFVFTADRPGQLRFEFGTPGRAGDFMVQVTAPLRVVTK
jgi:FtsP/CotA-like multicopper oxidase with cupredoxin domain